MLTRKARISVFFLAILAFGMLFQADTPAAAPAPRIIWLGPFAVTRMETARFNYTNFGTKPVDIAWAFSNAITGDVLHVNPTAPDDHMIARLVAAVLNQPTGAPR